MDRRGLLSRRRPPLAAEPDVGAAYKRAVLAAIDWAWLEVCARWPQTVRAGREEEITERIEAVLNEHVAGRRRAPGLASFETICRGGKVRASDGRIEKAPDLVFRPPLPRSVRDRSAWGWFVECKIIDARHPPRDYCENGVARFVHGEYAAKMPSALMLGYARDGSTPHATLSPLLARAFGTQRHDATSGSTCLSIHSRAVPRCPDISLTHLWLTP